MQSEEPAPVRVAEFTRDSVLRDYRVAYQSRQASLLGRREVLTGKAKFGIFGDGKELPQLAMARAFRPGDFRSGYYRDQTFFFATGMATLTEFFAQLYSDPDVEHDPSSAGRQMNAHFATRLLEPDGSFRNLAESFNSSADLSPTGSQMPRLVGLAYASKLYRQLPELAQWGTRFSNGGNEIAFGTIGNASAAEGMFWETVNAVGVLGVPMLLSIWDDGYGISVPNDLQVTKGSVSEALAGFQRARGDRRGYDIYRVKGWDYPALCETYLEAARIVRSEHVPAIVHVTEVTQPQGHSTSGSHERYKSRERLAWEEESDCIRRMRAWIIEQGIATASELEAAEEADRRIVREAQQQAWAAFRAPIDAHVTKFVTLAREVARQAPDRPEVQGALAELERIPTPARRELMRTSASILVAMRDSSGDAVEALRTWRREQEQDNARRWSSDLYSESASSALRIPEERAVWDDASPTLNGFEILTACFDANLGKYPNLIAIGEDVGQLGDVNQGFSGMQEKYGPLRVSDTGIRECTIVGQAIGMALRGLRPIAEMQYLDYILYGLQILSDDLASLRWRTHGGQKAPVIIRTRGHRLEGIWHSGSPMAGIIHLVRGMHVCVPRNMTQAAGMYNLLLQADDPAIVVEVLNGYRVKERLPGNIGTFTVPLGVPEVLREGSDVTVVTYGACCRIVLEAAELLASAGVEVEVIDVQTLLPFDLSGRIVESLRKTNRVLFVDEDVPGGATSYMLQEVLERQGGYDWLDSAPRTLTGAEHRPSYGSDGDYWSKPGRESVFRTVYGMMREGRPGTYGEIF